MVRLRRKLLIAAISCGVVIVACLLAVSLSQWPGIYENYSEPAHRTFRGQLKNRGAAAVTALAVLACVVGAWIARTLHRRRQRKLDEYISRKRP